jgi:hypothetical protein
MLFAYLRSKKRHVYDFMDSRNLERPGSASSFLALSDGELIAWGRGVASDSEEKEILPTREPGDIGSAVPGPLELRDFAVEVK